MIWSICYERANSLDNPWSEKADIHPLLPVAKPSNEAMQKQRVPSTTVIRGKQDSQTLSARPEKISLAVPPPSSTAKRERLSMQSQGN